LHSAFGGGVAGSLQKQYPDCQDNRRKRGFPLMAETFHWRIDTRKFVKLPLTKYKHVRAGIKA
jgi:hypothetical protein